MSTGKSEDKRKRPTSVGRALRSVIISVALLTILAAGAYLFLQSELSAPGPSRVETIVNIERGMSTSEIATRLHDAGAISNARLFTAAAMLSRGQGTLKAGEYALPKSASLADILDRMRKGKVLTYKVIFPEGLTTEQALVRVVASEHLTGAIGDPPPGEGTLLPDTYLFPRGTSRAEAVQRMQTAQTKLIDKLWKGRAKDLPIATKHEAIILASIVEKETGVPEERSRVAAVFINRLRHKMRLQSDPTIIYGIVGGKGKLDRPITRSDIKTKTPYNTYQIDGLPPTPICNPGKEAIAAVLNPDETGELYFVADGSGGHVFSKTLEEHKSNVRKWRKLSAERNAGALAEDDAETPEASTPAADANQAKPGEQPQVKSETKPAAADVSETETEKPESTGQAPSTASVVPLPKPKPKRPK